MRFWQGRSIFVLDGKDYYMDLLFYHRGLKRLVLVELKLGEFEPQDKGQVELYLRWLEKNERVEGEESPVALILCAEKSQETIELMQLDHGNIHVGQYMTKMPPKELLEQKLSLAIANARELLGTEERRIKVFNLIMKCKIGVSHKNMTCVFFFLQKGVRHKNMACVFFCLER